MDGSLEGNNFHQFPADLSNFSTPTASTAQQNNTEGVGTTAPHDGTAVPSLAFTPNAAPLSHHIVSPGNPPAPPTTPGACHSSPDNGGEGDSPDVSDSIPGERYRCGEPNCKRGFPRKCELR